MISNNFEWLLDDINDSYKLKVYYQDTDGNKKYGTYFVKEINRLDNENITVSDGNINDMVNLISGMVRFENEIDESKILDIPLRNLYMLDREYGDKNYSRSIDKDKLHGFSPVDIYDIEVHYYNDKSDDLDSVLEMAKKYFGMSEADKFKCIKELYEINKRRVSEIGQQYKK